MPSITRRRLFGLVGALAAVAAVPVEQAAASPLPPLPASAYPPEAVPLEIVYSASPINTAGDTMSGYVTMGGPGINYVGFDGHDTVMGKVGEAHFTLTVDASQLEAQLVRSLERARQVARFDDARWVSGNDWGA